MWGERQPLLAEHLEVLEQWLGHGSNDTLALALLMHAQGCRVVFGMSHGLLESEKVPFAKTAQECTAEFQLKGSWPEF